MSFEVSERRKESLLVGMVILGMGGFSGEVGIATGVVAPGVTL